MRDGIRLATDIYRPARSGSNDNHRWQIAENTVYLDAKHPSHIVLPVIPAE